MQMIGFTPPMDKKIGKCPKVQVIFYDIYILKFSTDYNIVNYCRRVHSSVVERNICIVEAKGSIPLASIFAYLNLTKKHIGKNMMNFLKHLSLMIFFTFTSDAG